MGSVSKQWLINLHALNNKTVFPLSSAWGDDKIEKYPVMFRRADVVIITKCDLLPYFDFSIEEAKAQLQKLNPNVEVISLSTKNPESFQPLVSWINNNLIEG